MKIVCDACQAKYSISDDKVQGKVFKIRCKKCSNIIVVRGGAGAAEPAPAPPQEKDTRVYDYGYDASGEHAPAGDEPVWHVVINQDQVGPMTAVEVQQKFSGGEIDSETYIWREGFADWLPLAQVDTFAQLASAGPAAAPSSRSGADAVASMFGGSGEDTGTNTSTRNDPGDLFATASGTARNDDDGGDLFGSKPAAPSSQGGAKLRGERNENSVLFSLNNLAQLASDKPAPTPSHTPASSSSTNMSAAGGGGSGGEGSGLIDIRSMASAYLGGPGNSAAKPASAGVGSIDDLPVFGGGGFSEPQVIVPIAARPGSGGNNKLMYALIGSVGLLAVAAAIVVVVLLRGDKPAQVASNPDKTEVKPEAKPPEAKPPETPAVAAPTPGSAEPPPTAPANPPPTAPTAKDPVKVATNDPPPTEPKHTTPTHKPTSSSSSSSTPKPPKPPVEKPPAVEKPAPVAKDPGGGSCDEVSCVLNNYEGTCCAKFRKGGGAAKPAGGGAPKAGDLPESLDRTMISDGVGKVKPRVMSCGEKSPAKGQVKVSVKVGPDGHVTSVTVKNTPDAGLGNCVASMMQKATFAKTQTGGSFAYPYTF